MKIEYKTEETFPNSRGDEKKFNEIKEVVNENAGASGGGQVDSVVAGTGTGVDATDPTNPVISVVDAEVGKYDIIACVIRLTGGAWDFVSGAHAPVNVASVSAVLGDIRLEFGKTYTKAITMIAASNQAYYESGLNFGTSLGLDHAIIKMYVHAGSGKLISGVHATNWSLDLTTSEGLNTPVWNAGTNSARVPVLNTEAKYMRYGATATSMSNVYRCIISDVQDSYIDVQFVDNAGTIATAKDSDMDFIINTNKPDRAISTLTLPALGDVWIFGLMER